jgi:hypothetical protein
VYIVVDVVVLSGGVYVVVLVVVVVVVVDVDVDNAIKVFVVDVGSDVVVLVVVDFGEHEQEVITMVKAVNNPTVRQ